MVGRRLGIVLLLLAGLAVLGAAGPVARSVSRGRYTFSFHVSGKPSGGLVDTAGGGSGSFSLGRRVRGAGTSWELARPGGDILLSYHFPVRTQPFLQSSVVGGTYTAARAPGGSRQTLRLELAVWSTTLQCVVTQSTRWTLVLGDSPQGKSDSVQLQACRGVSMTWKGSPPSVTVKVGPR